MARSIHLSPDYSDWTKSRLIERLEHCESRLLEVQRIAQIGHWERNIRTRKGQYSTEACRILGYDPNTYEPTYQGFIERVHPDDREAVEFQVADSERHGTAFNMVYRIIQPDGSVRTHHSRSEIHRDETGNPVRIAGTVQDITERVQAEAALRESEQRFALAVEGTNDGLWDRDLLTGDCYLSPRWKAILGYRDHELRARVETFFDLLHPDDRENTRAAVQSHIENGAHYDMEMRLRHKNGEYVWVRTKGRAARDGDGKPVRMVGSISDITELKEREKALRESEAQFRALIEDSNLGIHIGNMKDGRLFANRACADLFGFESPEELLAVPVLGLIAAHDKKRIAKLRKEVLERKTSEISYEYDALRKDGTIIPLQVFMQPTLWEGKDVLLRTFIDLTSRKRAEEQLRQAQKMEAVGQLTGGIAHEFNNLLMVVVGNLEMAMDRISDDATRKFASSAMKGAMRGAALTSQLLAFSRQQDLDVGQVELNRLVLGMRDMLQKTLGETIVVETELAGGVWPILADANQIEGALLNLALNARDAMPEGGKIVLTTSIGSFGAEQLGAHPGVTAGDYVMLEVADSGSGMTPEIVERVFDPFFTTKDVGEGTGLGLSMVHGFVEQSGGFVEIDSEVGRGTKVRMYLPRATGWADAMEHEEGDCAPVSGIRATVLVVEDDRNVRTAVVQLLTDLGCETIEAEDGEAALARLDERSDIDLLFTDVVLTNGKSGPDIARTVCQRYPDIKVLLTSGYPDRGGGPHASSHENFRFLQKPYRATELAETLANVLKD